MHYSNVFGSISEPGLQMKHFTWAAVMHERSVVLLSLSPTAVMGSVAQASRRRRCGPALMAFNELQPGDPFVKIPHALNLPGANRDAGGALGCRCPAGPTLGSHHALPSPLSPVALGRNERLRRDRPKWKSDYPMTDGQLLSKRDEFWDTAPAFDGRTEIWDALRAAAHAFESGDHELAQAILDGAGVTLPHGTAKLHHTSAAAQHIVSESLFKCCRLDTWANPKSCCGRCCDMLDTSVLSDCYDELGTRYQLPLYCLSQPVNMIEERAECDPDDPDDLTDPEPSEAPAEAGEDCPLRLRLSTGCDLRLDVRSTDSVCHMKRRLQAQEGVAAISQRWFFSGRPLADRSTLQELCIPSDYMVQVIVSQPPAPPDPAPGHS
ncbi:hypothetical protein P4O66_020051 [Electrophorus voltai]|uniref:Ubiquitin-like domain-containing protein n=1 Tax=Electrophorus voltai TaxID=2609070 RepID=A0AAD8ZTI5_9TELE|nr:hypothetical protein P4O66_020051 [Electrophorus voltai]